MRECALGGHAPANGCPRQKRPLDCRWTNERLAKALSVDVSQILKKNNLLEGICSEGAELLKEHQFSAGVTRVVRKMKPMRQVECVELMVSANNVTVSYAEALLVATPINMLTEGKNPERLP